MSSFSRILLIIGSCLIVTFGFGFDWFYDEAWTWQDVEKSSIPGVIKYDPFFYANNHLINSLWAKLLQYVGVSNLMFFRCLSILSGVVFFVFSFGLFQRLHVAKWKYLLIVVSPFLLFFSQARGYALSFAGLAVAFYYISFLIEGSSSWKQIFIIGISLSVSILSNFSFVFFNSVLLSLVVLRCFKISNVYYGLGLASMYLGPLLYTLYYGLRVSKMDPFIIGSDSFLDFIVAAIGCLAYSKPWGLLGITKWPIIVTSIVFGLAFIGMIRPVMRKKSLVRFLLLSLILSLGLTVASHLVLGSSFPVSRATLVYVYLVLIVVILGTTGYESSKLTRWSLVLYLAHSIIVCISFLLDLGRPRVRDVLLDTNDSNTPLYVWTYNPAYVQMAKEQNVNRLQSFDVDNINDRIKSDSLEQDEILLIIHQKFVQEMDLNSYVIKESIPVQRGMVLYRLEPVVQ